MSEFERGGGRGRGSDFESFSRRYEYHRLLTEYLRQNIPDFERSPELAEEMSQFIGYTLLLQTVVPTQLPRIEREEQIRVVHHAVDTLALPPLPITLPPPSRRIAVGQHMDITMGYSAVDVWPNESMPMLTLSDGTVVTPQTSVGKIDIVRNLPTLGDNTNLLGFTRELLKSSKQSMEELAYICQTQDNELEGVEVFAGVSHLARSAGRLGFTVFDIDNVEDRRKATAVSKSIAKSVAQRVEAWQELSENYKPAQIAFISREMVIDRFGT